MLKIENEKIIKQKNLEEVLNHFRTNLFDSNNFEEDEIEELVNAYSKSPTDTFIVSPKDLENTFGRQGDILFWVEGSEMYNSEIKTVTNLHPTDNLVLQEGGSITGDHRLILLDDTNYKLQEGEFYPSFLQDNLMYKLIFFRCLLFETDKPFLVYHSEHGNMAYPKGKYMICAQIEPATLDIMRD